MKCNIKVLPLVILPGDVARGYLPRRAPHIYSQTDRKQLRV